MEKEKKLKEIEKVLNKIRPFIQRDGGDVELVDYIDKIVYVRLLGACIGCSVVDTTLKDGIEALVKDEVSDVEAVELYLEDMDI